MSQKYRDYNNNTHISASLPVADRARGIHTVQYCFPVVCLYACVSKTLTEPLQIFYYYLCFSRKVDLLLYCTFSPALSRTHTEQEVC